VVPQADGSLMNWEVVGASPVPSSPCAPAETTSETAPFGHRYAVQVMSRAINLVLSGNTTLRAAAQCFIVLEQEATPSFWTIRFWLLRLGLYELQRPKPQASDWVFIVDATIAVGQHKALVILGVRLTQLRERGFSLGHQDVVALGLKILTRCDGVTVHAQLEAAAQAVGVPRSVVSDSGGDVKKGVRLFQQAHPGVAWNYDLTHRLARLLEKELGAASWWPDFLTRVGRCRHACQQTAWSHLLPPAQRTKARWFNLEPLIGWALQVLAYGRREGLMESKFVLLFGWLGAFEAPLQEARQMVEMIQSVCALIKEQGINAAQVEQCATRIEAIGRTERSQAFGRQILAFLREQAAQVQPGETLLGSSDVIESVFGKYKAVVERSPMKAMTVMVLLVAALTSERTPSVIRQAMETVGTAEVAAWFEANGEPTLLAKRRAALGGDKGTEHA
jgi:hypothetical protein